MNARLVSCLALVAVICGSFFSSQTAAAELEQAPAKIRQAMQDRDYDAAIKAIDLEAAAKDSVRPSDYLAYLKGRALHLAGRHKEAVTAFDAVIKIEPPSTWQRRARFGKALALAAAGDFRAAELIYRAEAKFLLSAERKQEVAGYYLEFADTYFKPPKEDQKPDYNKALQFFQKALELIREPARRRRSN